jgi:hypothetical protein
MFVFQGSINSEPPPPYLSTQILSMSAANITKAALPAAGSAPSTVPKFAAAHEAHIHHHRGIIGKVESAIHGTCQTVSYYVRCLT